MKNLLTLTFFFVCVNLHAQNSLTVNLVRCKNEKNDNAFGFTEITVYRNDTIFKTDNSNENSKYYQNIPNGSYTIKYKTFFGENLSKAIAIPGERKDWQFYEINLCIDEFNGSDKTSNKLFFNRLKNEEKLELKYSYAGCFNSGEDLITILKNNDKIYYIYKNRKRKLSKKQFDYFVSYEAEMRKVLPVDYRSTGNSLNTLSYNGEVFELNEPSSFWAGFSYLKQKLKLQ